MATTKYKSRKITVDGYTFDSIDESKYYKVLCVRKAKDEILNFEMQPKFVLIPGFKNQGKVYRAMTYTPDFIIYHTDGSEELVDKFEELESVRVEEILFIEDMEWEPGGAKYDWKAKIKKANKDLTEFLGYKYIIETRNYYTRDMDIEQLILLLYHELLHIDVSDDSIRKHNIEDWVNIVATFGKEWADTKAELRNILDDDFEKWESLLRTEKQISLFDELGVIDFHRN